MDSQLTIGKSLFIIITTLFVVFAISFLIILHFHSNNLETELFSILLAVLTITVLCILLYRFTRRLDRNIDNLRLFARRADRNESLDIEDLINFPADELGEISEYIIKIYKRLQNTKEEQNKLKRQLTQNIAHELKTPVASISGYLETILDNPNINEEMKQQFLERCYSQCQRLTSLLTDISTLNRLDDAPELMLFEEVDLVQTINQIITETTLEMRERNMTFVCHLPETLHINGCPSMLYSIFRNLTDNAMTYAGEGTTITLDMTEEQDGTLRFCFADNGVGIPHKHLARIFERFYRVDKGRSRKLGGTGLGLAIVKNAVLLHGGTIYAENIIGGGVRFIFTIRK